MTIVVLEDGLMSSFNHNLRMTLESLIEDVDELSPRRGGWLAWRTDKPSIKAPSVTCFGLVTWRVKVLQLETGCPLRRLFEVTSLEKLKLKISKAEAKVISSWKNWKTNQVNPCAHVVENLVSKQDPKFSSLKIWFSSMVQRLSNFREIRENILQRFSDFFNSFPISSMAFCFLQRLSDFPQRLSTFREIWENLSMAASIRKIAIRASYFNQNRDIPR